MFRPLKPYQIAVDVTVAVLLLLVSIAVDLLSGVAAWPGFWASVGWLGLPVIVILCAGLALRRMAPGLALAVVWAGCLLQILLGLPPVFANLAVFGVLYTVAAYGGRVAMWLGFASGVLGAALISVYLLVPPMLRRGSLIELLSQDYFPEWAVGVLAVWVAATFALLLSWTVGALVRTAVRARANREAQMRAQEDAIAEHERTAIARDMHDVVAHSLAVVIAQADGARYAAASDPQVAASALGTISTTARAALADVRLLLAQLRHSQTDGPQPTLADLEALYAQVRGAGVALRVDVDPVPRAEPPAAVQLALYRILQEALTNALRHGDGGEVSVSLAWHPGRVDLAVRNRVHPAHTTGDTHHNPPFVTGQDAAGPARGPAQGQGHGLIGMRERAQLAGGTLAAGRAGDAFVVNASIPLGVTLPAGAGAGAGAGALA